LRGRDEVEGEPSLEQIIPFIVFNYQGRYLLIRNPIIGEGKRQGKLYSLGVRGHLQEEDLEEDLSSWAKREFEKEVDHLGNLSFEVLGVLNGEDESLGVVIMAKGDSPQLKMREELKLGKLVTLSEAVGHLPFMNNWSQVVFDFLRSLEEERG